MAFAHLGCLYLRGSSSRRSWECKRCICSSEEYVEYRGGGTRECCFELVTSPLTPFLTKAPLTGDLLLKRATSQMLTFPLKKHSAVPCECALDTCCAWDPFFPVLTGRNGRGTRMCLLKRKAASTSQMFDRCRPYCCTVSPNWRLLCSWLLYCLPLNIQWLF